MNIWLPPTFLLCLDWDSIMQMIEVDVLAIAFLHQHVLQTQCRPFRADPTHDPGLRVASPSAGRLSKPLL